MKIFLAFLQDSVKVPHPLPAYRFWSYYVKNGIEESGMTWVELPGADWAEGLLYSEGSLEIKSWKERIWEDTLKYIKQNQAHVDFFLSYLYPKQIDTSAIDEIRKLGIPCINFYCDHVREFASLPQQFKVFDLMWVPEYEAIPLYKKAKIDYLHLPMPMWVKPAYRNWPTTQGMGVSFIGSRDILRQELLSHVIQRGLPVEIRGHGWGICNDESAGRRVQAQRWDSIIANQINFVRKFGIKGLMIKFLRQSQRNTSYAIPAEHIFGKPNDNEYVRLTRESSVSLGINRVPTFRALNTKPLVYSRLRDIEAPMLGACYLTEYTEGLNMLYEVGKEIETYSDAEELVFKCKTLIQNDAKRNDLRICGQKKALASLSIPVSLQHLSAKLYG